MTESDRDNVNTYMRIIAIAIFPLLLLLAGCSGTVEPGENDDASSGSSVRSVSSQATSSSQASYPSLSQQEKQKVESYIGENIDRLAVTPPSTLNGSFSVTEIEWYTENAAIVTFEDGQTIIKARATATVSGNNVRIVEFAEFSVEEK